MTVAELIAELQKLPQDAQIGRLGPNEASGVERDGNRVTVNVHLPDWWKKAPAAD